MPDIASINTAHQRPALDDFGLTPAEAARQERRNAVMADITAAEEAREFDREVEKAQRGDSSSWISMFANMLVSGSPIEQCALRLRRPRVQLEQIMDRDFFKSILEQVAMESRSNVGLSLLKGSTVDNIYTLLKLRDSPATKAETRAKIAMYLLDRTEGIPKQGHGGNLTRTTLDTLGDGGVDAATNREIYRLLDAHPQITSLRGSRSRSNNTDAPELKQESRVIYDARRVPSILLS